MRKPPRGWQSNPARHPLSQALLHIGETTGLSVKADVVELAQEKIPADHAAGNKDQRESEQSENK